MCYTRDNGDCIWYCDTCCVCRYCWWWLLPLFLLLMLSFWCRWCSCFVILVFIPFAVIAVNGCYIYYCCDVTIIVIVAIVFDGSNGRCCCSSESVLKLICMKLDALLVAREHGDCNASRVANNCQRLLFDTLCLAFALFRSCLAKVGLFTMSMWSHSCMQKKHNRWIRRCSLLSSPWCSRVWILYAQCYCTEQPCSYLAPGKKCTDQPWQWQECKHACYFIALNPKMLVFPHKIRDSLSHTFSNPWC